MAYSTDTSALVDAWSRWYPVDVFPAVWVQLNSLADSGELSVSEEVLHELSRRDDELHKWVKEQDTILVPTSQEVQSSVSEIMAEFPRLVDARSGKSFADPFVVAVARCGELDVVTGENPTGNRDRPKIPDVCDHFGIRCIKIVELFRDQGWTF